MTNNAINSVLYNVDQTADTTAAEKAQARANIGAQGALTAGPNIDIYNDIISTEKPRVEAGTNVSVNGVLDPQTRVVTYTVSATDTTYNVFNTTTDGLVPKANGTGDTGKFLKGDGTWEAVNTTVNASAPLYGTGTQADPIRLLVSHGLSLVQPSGGDTALQVTHPVPAPGSTSAGKVLTCDDALGNLAWRDVPVGTTWAFDSGYCIDCTETVSQGVHTVSYDLKVKQDGGLAVDGTEGLYCTRTQVNSVSSSSQGQVVTPVSTMNINGAGTVTLDANAAGFLLQAGAGSATAPVYIDAISNEAVACDRSAFEGTRHELVMASSVTLDSTSNEQDWPIAAQHGWPYGWSSYRFEWNGIVTSSQNITVRFYERTFSYNGVDGSFTPNAEKLLATAYLRSGTGSVNVAFTTEGWPNRRWLSSLHVTVQPDSAASGTVTISEQAGSYTAVNSGAEIITTPNTQPPGPWTPPNQ